uniref:Murein DD-endopeptidase MepM and murein hydrolase activator NlpD, contain LysM domain n=1 Tax=Candidatus Kentrum sp. DK TaxID=2126562 RepID=A0A450S424_9GAMM|nr:MAG: Murein DD-endopeptidase MepM and murein hydrolase activator NlpD, contain LysM domain [Candidatus Kentron sp. DK]
MQNREKKQAEYLIRFRRFIGMFPWGTGSRYSRLKNALLSIAIAMIAISVLPIPLGNASSKLPLMTLEVPLREGTRGNDFPPPGNGLPEDHSQKKETHHLTLSTRIKGSGGEKKKNDGDEASPSAVRADVIKGDSLSMIFNRLDLPQSTLHNILEAGDEAKRLKNLHPGQTLQFELDEHRNVRKVSQRLDDTTVLEVALHSDGGRYRSKIVTEPTETRVVFATGVIDQSLFLAGQRAGLSDKVIMEMVGIFAWDVDFALNVRTGDRFALIYEQYYKDGERVRDGNVMAAEFVNQGHVFHAIRYENKKGLVDYYTPDGHNMRKQFLRTPVEFTRISSRFQRRRWHPVLHKFRAHRGVDYAAPRGTPVKVTANGRITFLGHKGGLGKAVFVQHGRKYTTVYGHLNNYAKGIRKGKILRQGQLVGYVGSTGLATGPHLHYEFRVDGAHRDPLKVKLPKADPIEARYLTDFKNQTKKLIAQLGVLSRTMLATQPEAKKKKS